MSQSPVSNLTPQGFLTAWQETFNLAVNEYNFKNGAFKGLITPSTSVMEALDILLDSDRLARRERTQLLHLRQVVATMIDRASTITIVELVVLATSVNKVTDIFDNDRKKQGQYVPPMLMQSIGKDNKITSTCELTDESIKTTPGGQIGHIPSAPAEFNRLQEEHFRSMGLKFGLGSDASKPSKRGHTTSGAANKVKDNKPAKDINEHDFGAAFKKNVRGAFS